MLIYKINRHCFKLKEIKVAVTTELSDEVIKVEFIAETLSRHLEEIHRAKCEKLWTCASSWQSVFAMNQQR